MATTPPGGGQQPAAIATWTPAQEVPGSAALETAGNAEVYQVTCPEPGDCVAAGLYQPTVNSGAWSFLTEASGGKWQPAENVLSETGGFSVGSLSCAPDGACTRLLINSAGSIVAETETVGTGDWSAPQPITLSPAPLNPNGGDPGLGLLSCTSAGNCGAGGGYSDTHGWAQAMVDDEKNGTWGTGEEVPGTAALNAGIEAGVGALSCASDGNCAAGGTYQDAALHRQAFVVDETDGTWGTAVQLPGIAALEAGNAGISPQPGGNSEISSLSCGAPGDCAAVGTYWDSYTARSQAFVADETNGVWGNAIELPGSAALNTANNAQMHSVSCTAAGDCSAVGTYLDDTGIWPLVDTETGGTWATAQALPAPTLGIGDEQPVEVSCSSAGNCAAGGYYEDNPLHDQAMMITETDGTWGVPAELPGTAALNAGDNAQVSSVSCAPSGDCAAGGYYTDSAKLRHAFIANTAEPTTTAITVSTPSVTFGNEQAATVSVSVKAQALPPAGTVTVTSGSKQVCVITLANGAGTCTVPATRLHAGTATLTAAYPGTDFIAPSASSVTLHVSAAPSRTALSLRAGKVTYGHEQAELASVTVMAPYSLPVTGKIAVKSGTATLCTITLVPGPGAGGCKLSATSLPAGIWHLTAAYSGNGNIAASVSQAVPLTIAKAGTATTLTLSAARVRYGSERTERMTVAVTAKYGKVPGTKVTIKSGRTVLCSLTLASGKGTCTLTARQLHPGTYTLTAAYPGNANFAGSASARKTLTVTR